MFNACVHRGACLKSVLHIHTVTYEIKAQSRFPTVAMLVKQYFSTLVPISSLLCPLQQPQGAKSRCHWLPCQETPNIPELKQSCSTDPSSLLAPVVLTPVTQGGKMTGNKYLLRKGGTPSTSHCHPILTAIR